MSKCKRLWKSWEKDYTGKPGGEKEAATEKRAYYCNGKDIMPRTQENSDADVYDVMPDDVEVEKKKKKKKKK